MKQGALDPIGEPDWYFIGKEMRKLLNPIDEPVRDAIEKEIWQRLPRPSDNKFRDGWKDQENKIRYEALP